MVFGGEEKRKPYNRRPSKSASNEKRTGIYYGSNRYASR